MNDDLTRLETWAAPLLAKLQPNERRKLAVIIATDLRRSNQRRIAAQQNPDGSAYAPRKQPKQIRTKAGRIKKQAMFAKLRKARHLKATADASGAIVGFVGRVARIARVHQEGLTDKVNRTGMRVQYEKRQLLGFNDGEMEMIRDRLLDHLS